MKYPSGFVPLSSKGKRKGGFIMVTIRNERNTAQEMNAILLVLDELSEEKVHCLFTMFI